CLHPKLQCGPQCITFHLGRQPPRLPFAEALGDSLLLVYRFIETGTYYNGTSNASNFRQRCTTGATLISVIPLSMRSLNSSQEATRIPRRNVRAIFPNRVSTRFNHDPWVGVCT